MEQNSQDEHDDILQLRAERIQEAIVKVCPYLVQIGLFVNS